MKARPTPIPLALACAVALLATLWFAWPHAQAQPSVALPAPPAASAASGPDPTDRVARGRYLVAAGDCVACHTLPRQAPFSGGRPVQTPFGTVLSANLTPDDATGIGRYTADTFYRALHEGLDHEGRHLYPAFPYPYYTHVTRDDSDAIYAYLRTLAPVSHAFERNRLRFPFNVRSLMAAWNLLYFKAGSFRDDPDHDAQWNRGAYLVQGLGHCEACHTPRNMLGGPQGDAAFHGGRFADWVAPDITPNRRTGIGSWHRGEVIDFLRSGRNDHAGASGEMAEVVTFSTSQLREDDLAAIAAYLATVAPASDTAVSAPDAAQMSQGRAIWLDACAACHRDDGRGAPGELPPLRASANLQQRDPTTVLHYILAGAQHRSTDRAPTTFAMPPFDWKLDDAQVAAVATYARNSWGNAAPAVAAADVAALRERLDRAHESIAAWPPTPRTGRDLMHPNPTTLSTADTDSRDNGTPSAGRRAP